jgi:hypothetical protein
LLFLSVGAALSPALGQDDEAKADDLKREKLSVLVLDGDGRPIPEATAQFHLNYQVQAEGATDANGRFTCRVPADAPQWTVVAYKSGVGLDYATASQDYGGQQEPAALPDEVKLTLDGARSVRFRAIDHNGQPVAGVRVGPWILRKPGYDGQINLSGASASWPVTNEMGTATLDWLPEHFDKYLSFTNHVEGYYAPEHSLSIRADEEVDELTIHLLPLEKLSGRVMLPDGRPAPGANVALRGQGTTHNGFHGGTSADDEGRFELAVYSEQAYLVVASHDELISPVQKRHPGARGPAGLRRGTRASPQHAAARPSHHGAGRASCSQYPHKRGDRQRRDPQGSAAQARRPLLLRPGDVLSNTNGCRRTL